MDNGKYHINSKNFVIYKFLNSLFMGTSIGCIFTIYMPLEPSIYSIGGIVLALGSILIATQYAKIAPNYFKPNEEILRKKISVYEKLAEILR